MNLETAGLGAFGAALLTSLLPAQARAPFRGTVRDLDGKPLAGADVTCVFVPGFAVPGTPDRVSAQTDDRGAFTAQLQVGLGYVVWAMGPADAQGSRSVAAPQPDAAAGRKLELTVQERRAPTKVRIRGSTAWIAEGPLSLRMYVAGACVAGPDLVIPGDGAVTVPAMPAVPCSAALVDGRGSVIQVRPCSAEGDAVSFAEPRFVPVVAVDQDGKPMPGVAVLQPSQAAGPAWSRLADATSGSQQMVRAIGITGADGSATVCCAGEPGVLLGRLDGRAACWSGWVRGVRLHDGMQVADEGALLFTMRPAEPRTLRVVGLAGDDRIQVGFRAQPWFQTTNGGSSAWCDLAAAAAGKGIWSAEGARNEVPLTAQVRFAEIAAVPRRLVATEFLEQDGFRDFDMGGLRRMTVTVLDADGSPASCACLGVAGLGCAPHLCWRTQLVTDGAGRAEFCMNRSDHWVVHATTDRAYALALVKVQDLPGPIEMKLLPLPVMKLRIVDRDHRAVRGASLVCTGSRCGAGGGEAEVRALDGIALSTNGAALWPLRSNAAGEVEVPFLDRPAVTTTFEARAGRLVAGDLTLHAGETVQEIVLR